MSWKCFACGYPNPSQRAVCFKCDAVRPEPQLIPKPPKPQVSEFGKKWERSCNAAAKWWFERVTIPFFVVLAALYVIFNWR